MREDTCDVAPTCMSVAPCSEPSRPSPAGGSKSASLDGPCARRPATTACRDEGTAYGTNKGTAPIRRKR